MALKTIKARAAQAAELLESLKQKRAAAAGGV